MTKRTAASALRRIPRIPSRKRTSGMIFEENEFRIYVRYDQPIERHRNAGAPFWVVRFTFLDEDREPQNMMATVFDDNDTVAVINLGRPGLSYRGGEYEGALRMAIAQHTTETYGKGQLDPATNRYLTKRFTADLPRTFMADTF